MALPWGSGGQVAIYYHNPTPTGLADTLLPPILYDTSPGPAGAVIMDVDGDGANDLVVSCKGASSLNVFFQR